MENFIFVQCYQTLEKSSYNFLGILRSTIFQKPHWMVTLSYEVIFLLSQCHSKVEKSRGQSMGQNTGKPENLNLTSATLTKAGVGGDGCFIF